MTTQKTCMVCKDRGWFKSRLTKRIHACDVCNPVEMRVEFLMNCTGATQDQAKEAVAWGIAQALGTLNDRYRKYK